MALKFLNKKGWHTGSLRNIENVWKAEQRAEAEQRKSEELRKQIHEEKERWEFRKLQEQAGLVPKQERLEFLYESGLGVGKPSDDEYLLGKPVEEPKGNNVVEQVAATPGSLFVEEKISSNDQWRKIRSDPLLLIKQQELAAREKIKNNPLKMEALRKEVELKKKSKEERKRMKAEEKKKRKELKRKMKMRSESGDEKEDSDTDRRRRRHDSSSSEDERENREEGRKRERGGEKQDERAGERKKDKECSDYKDERGRDYRRASMEDSKRRDRDDRENTRERARDDHYVGRRERERGDYRRERDSGRDGWDGDKERENERGTRISRERDDVRRERETERERDRDDARQTNRSPRREDNRRGYGKPPLPKKVKLTDEEKMARLQEMQRDAELHEEQRWKRIKTASASDAIQEQQDAVKLSRNFLDQTSRSIYGTEDGGSVAEALHRKSHYREKFTDQNAFKRS